MGVKMRLLSYGYLIKVHTKLCFGPHTDITKYVLLSTKLHLLNSFLR